MKRTVLRLLLWINLLFVVIAYLSGCAATKPNTPFAGPYPKSFNELSAKNQLLAEELGKLPEFQDGITNAENNALERLVTFYNKNQRAFDKSFVEMYKIGKPEVRKYCSPLQALFWLANDNEFISYNDLLSDNWLKKLLKKAWKTDRLSYRLISDKQIREVINGIEDEDRRRICLGAFKDGDTFRLQNLFLLYYEMSKITHKQLISKKAVKIIKENILTPKSPPRWKDFNTVVDRLNAPELLDYYINQKITYKKNRINSHTPKHTYSHQWGDCDDLSVFGKYILSKGGYKAWPRYVHWTHDNRGHVGVVIILKDGRYLLAVDFDGRNRISGPYTKLSEVDKTLSRGHFINDSGWWQQPR